MPLENSNMSKTKARAEKTPRNFGIDPTGNYLIAANQDSDTLAIFKIDQNSGALEPIGDTAVGTRSRFV